MTCSADDRASGWEQPCQVSSNSSTRDPSSAAPEGRLASCLGHVTSAGGSECARQEPQGQHPQPLQCSGQAGRAPLPCMAAGHPTALWMWDERLVWGGEQGEQLPEPLRVFSRSTVAARCGHARLPIVREDVFLFVLEGEAGRLKEHVVLV